MASTGQPVCSVTIVQVVSTVVAQGGTLCVAC
eukprot:SAG25_NODE_7900_length_451_cov_0.857955_2_plen_31_part_01